MKLKRRLSIKEDIFDVNLVFYNFLKKITQAHFTDKQLNEILALCYSNSNEDVDKLKEILYEYVECNIKRNDLSTIYLALAELDSNNIDIFVFSLNLNLVKDLLLEEAKLAQTLKVHQLKGLNQLSLKYDKVSTQAAYATRISGALLSLLFFEKVEKSRTSFISDGPDQFFSNLKDYYKKLIKIGLKPNQIFMLLFSESINQSITSSAGASFEDRIKNVLISLGIPREDITKTHDIKDTSTEFDFFFKYNNKSFGISAKRTLRERYKQFIKTAQMSKIDIMVEITLGTDLRENIVNSIRQHGVYIFVADEVYNTKQYMKDTDGVYPASKLDLNVLDSLSTN